MNWATYHFDREKIEDYFNATLKFQLSCDSVMSNYLHITLDNADVVFYTVGKQENVIFDRSVRIISSKHNKTCNIAVQFPLYLTDDGTLLEAHYN